MAIVMGGITVGNRLANDWTGKKLNFVVAEKSMNWDKQPVRITDAEWRTLNAKRVLAIMQGEDLTPSFLAGLQENEIVCPTINLIDELFHDALGDYKQRLKEASEEDLDQIKVLSRECKTAPLKLGAGGILAGAGTGALIGSPFGPPGAALGAIAGGVVGLVSGFFGGRTLTQRLIEREGSAHRFKWIQSVDVLEDVRFKQISYYIYNASVPLVEVLKSLEEEHQTDKHHVKQLHQLLLVHQAIFVETPLEILLDPSEPNQIMNVEHYVQTLIQKFPAINLGQHK